MRTLFSNEFHVDYGQMYIDGRTRTEWDEGPEAGLHECFMGQRAGLCGAAVPGYLHLSTGMHTGSVPLAVELHEKEPPLDSDGWEDIVEASFRTAADDTSLISWGGGSTDLGLPSGSYRVRYHCRGMDEAGDSVRRVGEPVLDEYLLQFWPAPPERDRVVKETTRSATYWHRWASELPPPPTPEELAEARRAAQEKKEREERELRERAEKNRWGGRLPSDRLRNVKGNVAGMVNLDVALVHAIDEAGPDVQRAIARWAAHRSCDVAGLSSVDWIARGLAELDRNLPFSPPLNDAEQGWDLLFSDPQVPSTTITTPIGTTNASQQAMAFPALTDAAAPDPLQAALDALYAAAIAHGTGWRDLVAKVRSTFPETAHAPLPPLDRPQRYEGAAIVFRQEWRPTEKPQQQEP
ncbi:hypothetical protein AB0C81_26855 [Streptomyces roseoverticillatus]|uniref:hypothetical protein n=1 Tax=Streptomyces roseoverticillatus TaxID=66429 RepID=UPI0033EFE66E